MKRIAFIPARGGSKGIPGKNIKSFCGKALILYTLEALQKTKTIDEIVLSTDSKAIIHLVSKNLFQYTSKKNYALHHRSEQVSQDTSSTEEVMLEFLQERQQENTEDFIFMLVQCTNPFLTASQIDEAVELYEKQEIGSMLSCIRSPRFIWNTETHSSVNYDYKTRPRRQDNNSRDHYSLENGSFYLSKASQILCDRNRLTAPISFYEMPWYSMVELDSIEDWKLAEFVYKEFHEKSSSSR